MIKTRNIIIVVLCWTALILLSPGTALADTITEVATVSQLKEALANEAGAHVKLTADIILTKADGGARLHEDDEWEQSYGIVVGRGCYTIDLNSHKIEYNYMRSGNNDGAPLITVETRSLTINGPGSIVGGVYAVEHNSSGVLTINGGALKGVMNAGLRATKGITYMNSGSISGNFCGVSHEGGIIVVSGGNISSIKAVSMSGHSRGNYGVIKDGVFTGQAIVENAVLAVDDLAISSGSSLKVARQGGLVVRSGFVNNGSFAHEGGLLSINGTAELILGANIGAVYITEDMSFSSLTMKEQTQLCITNGATLIVTGAFINDRGEIRAENGYLSLLGSVDHRGRSQGLPQLAALEDGGPPPPEGPRPLTPVDAAESLKELGLFRGVGVNPDGSTNFDLYRAPSRVEALVMLIRLLGQEEAALAGEWSHPFTDAPAWADKYVGYAYEKGLTKGVSANKFGVGSASRHMYLTFVLRALGYRDGAGLDFTWDAPEALAETAGVLPTNLNAGGFLRADVVLISHAALSAKLKDSQDTLLDKLKAAGAVTGP